MKLEVIKCKWFGKECLSIHFGKGFDKVDKNQFTGKSICSPL
jgi:hypothetical protein